MNDVMIAELKAYLNRRPGLPATLGIIGKSANLIITDEIGLTENAATRKIKDMEARVAVEGNTDGNHDNVEGAE